MDKKLFQEYRWPLIIGAVAVLLFVVWLWPRQEEAVPPSVSEETYSEPVPSAEEITVKLPEKLAQYEGQEPQLVVYIAEEGTTRTMAFEEYIAGVVAAEMDPEWPQAALAAQAILSRSFTLQKIGETGGAPQHNADASTSIQEFQAFDSSKVNEAILQAVADTRGQVLIYSDQFVHGWFHSDSGGVTATAEEGLGYTKAPTPYIAVVEDSLRQPPEEIASWQVRFPAWQVANAVVHTGVSIPSLQSISIAETGPSGRVTSFHVNGETVDALLLRSALGSTALKSLLLTAEPYLDGDQVVFQGRGYGHGVGMSQYGAKGMAEAGKNPQEILTHFFLETDVVQLYS